MKPVKQLIYNQGSNGVGDCLRACVASILEIPIETVPNFIEYEKGGNEYLDVMNEFLRKYRLKSLNLSYQNWDDPQNWKPPGYHMIYGYSERGIKHAVVGYQGQVVFDPHPDETGLVEIDSYTIFVASLGDIEDESDLKTGEYSVRSTA